MTNKSNIVRYLAAGFLAVALCGTASAADRKTTNTILGAGLGAAAGAVLSQGDPLLTIGGAAAGGVLGNVLTEDRRDRRWHGHHGRDYRPKHRYVEQRHYRGKHYRGKGHYKSHGRGHRHHHHR